MYVTRQDREALDEILEFFNDCKDLTEDHVNAMLVILVEHRQLAVSAATENLRAAEGYIKNVRHVTLAELLSQHRTAAVAKREAEIVQMAVDAQCGNAYIDIAMDKLIKKIQTGGGA